MSIPLTELQEALKDHVQRALAEREVTAVKVREKIAAADPETGLPGERTLIVSFPVHGKTYELWLYADEVGIEVPGGEWVEFEPADYDELEDLAEDVADYVDELLAAG